MAKNKVTLTFAGDESDLERSTRQVGRALDRVDERVRNSGSVLDSFGDAGGESAGKFSVNFIDRIGPLMVKAPISGPLVAAFAAAAPAAAAALTTGILLGLGGGVLAAGIMAAAKDPAVAAAFSGLGDRAKKSLSGFADPFKGPLIRAADTFGDALERMAPTLKEMGATIAPIIDRLAPAFAQMAEKALPGIKTAVEASIPLFEKLAEHAPKIGEAIGQFFEIVAKGAPHAVRFFDILLKAATIVIPILGRAIAFLTGWFAVQLDTLKLYWRTVVNVFNGVRSAIGRAASWVVDRWNDVVGFFRRVPGAIGRAVSGIARTLVGPFQSAFNAIRWAWNNTIGRLSWTVPGWVPGIGGMHISAPRLHQGGVVPGPPGQETVAILQAGERVLPMGESSTTTLVVQGGVGGQQAIADLVMNLIRTGAIKLSVGNGGRVKVA